MLSYTSGMSRCLLVTESIDISRAIFIDFISRAVKRYFLPLFPTGIVYCLCYQLFQYEMLVVYHLQEETGLDGKRRGCGVWKMRSVENAEYENVAYESELNCGDEDYGK